MTKHISDSERITIAVLNKKETELKNTKEELNRAYAQLKAMSDYISELKDSNKILAAQVRYLVTKRADNG